MHINLQDRQDFLGAHQCLCVCTFDHFTYKLNSLSRLLSLCYTHTDHQVASIAKLWNELMFVKGAWMEVRYCSFLCKTHNDRQVTILVFRVLSNSSSVTHPHSLSSLTN